MRTMHPVLMTGANEWDQAWLPRDEYTERLRLLRLTMAQRGWRGLIVHGDCDRCPLVSYLTNFHPGLRWAIVLVGPQGDPELVVPGGTRDLPAALDQTWLKKIASFGDAAKVIPAWIAGLGERPKLAAYGFATMRPSVDGIVTGAVGALAEVEHVDAELDQLLFRAKRPREVEMIRRSGAHVEHAAQAFAEKLRAGASVTEAALAMERAGRLTGAHDVRIMLSFDGGKTLRPFVHMTPGHSDPIVAYVGLRHTDYWAEAFMTVGASDAVRLVDDALDDAIAGLKPGMSGRDIAGLMDRRLGAARAHSLVGAKIGHGIGLALEEAPLGRADGAPVIVENGVYSLHAGLDDAKAGVALASAIVLVSKGSTHVLCRPRLSPRATA